MKNVNDEQHHLVFVSNGVKMELAPMILEPSITISILPVESPEKGYFRLYFNDTNGQPDFVCSNYANNFTEGCEKAMMEIDNRINDMKKSIEGYKIIRDRIAKAMLEDGIHGMSERDDAEMKILLSDVAEILEN